MVSAEQVRESVLANSISRVPHHVCALCQEMVYYRIESGQLFFDPSCACASEPPQPRLWQAAADFINRQPRRGPHGDLAARVARGFGLTLSSSESAVSRQSKRH